MHPPVREAILDARAHVTVVKAPGADSSSASCELIRDLAFLASKESVLTDERTIRRYLDKNPKPFKTPVFQFWRRNWGLIGPVVNRLFRTRPNEFERVAKSYLDPSS